ncbi:MAG: ATP-binding cassette domain-containing protein [Burkholderiales bacterium]|nr:ATP-binding cassette domain-containing protein [Burkholderiales bacterium]
MIRIEGLDVSIGAVSILRNVAMELPSGKFTGLVGRNGAGKTTLMRAIMGILPARNGSIHFESRTLDTTATHLRARAGFGYMPEDRRLVPHLTVEENVLMPAWASGLRNPSARLANVYEMIPEVEAFAARKAVMLSGGQQKLVALARALMCGTKVLLLDEPFEGVAPVLARRLAEVIAGLRQGGLSILLTESDLSHSKELLDSLYVIDRGEVRPGSLQPARGEGSGADASA